MGGCIYIGRNKWLPFLMLHLARDSANILEAMVVGGQQKNVSKVSGFGGLAFSYGRTLMETGLGHTTVVGSNLRVAGSTLEVLSFRS